MRKILICSLVACTLIATPVMAEPQALGRLFFTPAERAALDRARAGIPADSDQTSTVIAPKRATRLNGFVERSDGKATVWVDGEPRYRREASTTISPSAVETAAPIVVRRSSGTRESHR